MTTNEIYHLDCREGVALIPDNSVDVLLTDPPFGIAFQSNSSVTPEGKQWAKPIANDDDLTVALDLFEEAVVPLLQHKAKDNFDAYIFTKWSVLPPWMELIQSLPDLELKMLIVWDKMEPGMGDLEQGWGCGHEMILYARRGRLPKRGSRRGAVVRHEKTPPAHGIHPTEKPVGLLKRLLGASAGPGATVVDLFSGSGSTSVASKELGMNSYAFEVDDDHFKNSTERLSQDTIF